MTASERSETQQAVSQGAAGIEYRLLVENVRDVAIFLMDPEGCITSWNAAAERMKGWPAEQIIGQHYRILYLPEDAAARKPEQHLEQARTSGKFEEKAWRKRKDGSRFWADVTLTPLYGAGGELRGFAKITHDRTEEKAREYLLSTVANRAADAIFLLDGEGRTCFVNAAAERMFGWSQEELRGKGLHEVIHYQRPDGSPFPQADCPLCQVPGSGKTLKDHDDLFIHRAGHGVPVLCSNAPVLEEGQVPCAVLVVHDLTERKRLEADLERAHEERRELLHREQEARGAAERERDLVRRVMENAPLAIGVLEGPEHRFTLVNPETARLCGAPMEQFLGRTHREVNPAGDEAIGPVLDRVFSTGQPEALPDVEVALPNGKTAFMHVIWTPLPERDGKPSAVLYLALDTTQLRATQEALRSSEARFRAMFEQVTVGIAQVDLTGRFVLVNRRQCEILGRSREELLQMRMQDVTHPDDLPRNLAMLERLVKEGRGFVIEKRYVRPDGTSVWVNNSVSRALDSEGDAEYVVAVVEDITERKLAQEVLRTAHDTFRHLVEHSPFGIYAVDSDFRLVQVSAGAQKVFENVRPLLGRDFAEVLRCIWPEPFASEAIGRFRHTLETGEPYHAPSTVERRRDIGEVEAYDWKTERITLPDGRFGVVCHFYDLSERQHYEEALREANELKDEFLAMLAHELRNPVGAIRNAVGVLERAEPGSDAFQRGLEVAKRQMQHQSQMVDDLLDLSRISRGKLELREERLDLAQVVRDTAEDFRREVERRGLTLTVELLNGVVPVRGDRTRLSQVLGNLLHNAAKFTLPGGEITVEVTQETRAEHGPSRPLGEGPGSSAEGEGPRHTGDVATVRVRDTGIGIDPKKLPELFEPFAQAGRGPDRAQGGLGLGLALVKGLVEMHGGEVWGHSAGEGAGAEFTFYLPLEKQPLHTPEAHASVPSAGGSLRVLVIEDIPDAAETLRDLLELSGHTVEVAYSGPSGLAAAERFRPEVVLCDLGLPGMDGYAVAEELRRHPLTTTTHLIALTGYGQEEDRRRSRAAGFDLHLTKPVDPEELNRVLASLGGALN